MHASDASASRTKARATALSRQLDFYARTTNFRSHPRAVRVEGGTKGDEGAEGVSIPTSEVLGEAMTSLREELFEIESYTVVTHPFAHPSPRASIFFAFPPVSSFFLLPVSFFLSTLSYHFRICARRVVCTDAKLSVISDRMARLTPTRFYAPSWITCARTSIVCTRAWR